MGRAQEAVCQENLTSGRADRGQSRTPLNSSRHRTGRSCLSGNRVFYTTDADFLALAADLQQRGVFFPGVIYHRQGSRSKRQIIDALVLCDGVFGPDNMHNRIEFI